jgi:hypothetical protein
MPELDTPWVTTNRQIFILFQSTIASTAAFFQFTCLINSSSSISTAQQHPVLWKKQK